MAVTVTIREALDSGPGQSGVAIGHPKGVSISVQDGHLSVWGGGPATSRPAIAIYAPGNWVSAQVLDE